MNRKSRTIPLLPIFSAVSCIFWITASHAAVAGGQSCSGLFQPSKFEVSTTISVAPILAMVPGAGSLESRFPGLIHKFVELRARVMVADERFLESQNQARLREELRPIREGLANIRTRVAIGPAFAEAVVTVERRLIKMISVMEGPAKKTTIEGDLRLVESHIWEIAVAGMFGGDKVFLNRRLSDLYPYEFKKLSREDRRRLDREIDIAILKKDGSWEWVEVKDWSLESELGHDSANNLFKQSAGQFFASRGLHGPKVKLTLVMKYPLPEDALAEYQARSRFDQILFVFPETTPSERVQLDLPTRNVRELREMRHNRLP